MEDKHILIGELDAIDNGSYKVTDTNSFIVKAKMLHKNKYDYSLTIYKNYKSKVRITCSEHGVFEQTPNNHLSRMQNCKKCHFEIIKKNTDFVKRANIIHDEKYDYSLVVYNRCDEKVKIICPAHGIFEQSPNHHLSKRGCIICSGKNKKTTDEFILAANKVHNFKYDYSKAKYETAGTKINIICKQHGEFNQSPKSHLNGNGCPSCTSNVSKKEILWLDFLNIPSDFRNKIIFIGDAYIRTDACDEKTKTIYEFYGDFWHGNPKRFKPDDINPIVKKTYGELYERTLYREKMITVSGYSLVTIWETEFDQILAVKNNGY